MVKKLSPPLKQVLCYLAIIIPVLLASSLFVYKAQSIIENRPASADRLPQKSLYYLAHKNEFDALFLGDSRTLCGMHPDTLEPYWELKAFNLAHWATWFPNQYALFSDIVPSIPPGTVVIWSIGHQNFDRMEIKDAYPVGWKRMPYYIGLGYTLPELIQAQLSEEPLAYIIGNNSKIYTLISQILKKPLLHIGQEPKQNQDQSLQTSKTDNTKALNKFRNESGTGFIKPWYDESGNLVSIAQYKTNGAYLRTELTPSYYRQKQVEQGSTLTFTDTFDAKNKALFIAMLKLFKKHKVKLIVNEFEEAPYRYANAQEHKKYQDFMHNEIKPIVESYGFPYISIDFNKLSSDDYFDFNHLNQDGVPKYSALLGPKLNELKTHAF